MRTDVPDEFLSWFESLDPVRGNDGPSRGTISAALSVLDALLSNFTLDINKHTTPKGTSINSASGPNERRILAKFNEERPYTAEGGRTNRGAVDGINSMLLALDRINLDQLSEKARNQVLISCQVFLIDRIRDFFNKKRIEIEFQPRASTWFFINSILKVSNTEGKWGAVSQHLVGAKLCLRFPNIVVTNLGFTTADQQTDRPGDFLIGDTAIHVTVSPVLNLLAKCKKNIQDGYKVYILVPDEKLIGTRQIAKDHLGDNSAIESIESFVSQNIEELSEFRINERKHQLRRLLNTYNHRVDRIEKDKSLMVEIPKNLK